MLHRLIELDFYKTLEDFKIKFQKIEKLILGNKAQKLLIFIDDLDRCEPENVLNLITAIKLFFTYGEDSVYFCGLDKTAVNMAVKTKYKDEVKAEEYLEKVFDISFNMPKTYDIRKILLPQFKNFKKILEYKDLNGIQQEKTLNSIGLIEEFFKAIQFTNPRHLKKVLNKYEILKAYNNLSDLNGTFKSLIPEIIYSDKEGNLFETIYCLYMIILHEFYVDEFQEIENYEYKMVNYLKAYENQTFTARKGLKEKIYYEGFKMAKFNDFQVPISGSNYGYSKFLFLFSNNKPQLMNYMFDHDLDNFTNYFPDDSLPTNYCIFLIKYIKLIEAESIDSDYIIWNLFDMVKYLL